MAEDTSNDSTDSGTPGDGAGVRLTAPDGSGEVTVRSPEAVTNLVYGQGYRLVGDDDPEAAVQAAADANDDDHQAPSTPTAGSVSDSTTGTAKAPRAGGKSTAQAGTTPPSTT